MMPFLNSREREAMRIQVIDDAKGEVAEVTIPLPSGTARQWMEAFVESVCEANRVMITESITTTPLAAPPEVQPQFRFKVGQRVVIRAVGESVFVGARLLDDLGPIYSVCRQGPHNTSCYIWRESELEPAPEPQP